MTKQRLLELYPEALIVLDADNSKCESVFTDKKLLIAIDKLPDDKDQIDSECGEILDSYADDFSYEPFTQNEEVTKTDALNPENEQRKIWGYTTNDPNWIADLKIEVEKNLVNSFYNYTTLTQIFIERALEQTNNLETIEEKNDVVISLRVEFETQINELFKNKYGDGNAYNWSDLLDVFDEYCKDYILV